MSCVTRHEIRSLMLPASIYGLRKVESKSVCAAKRGCGNASLHSAAQNPLSFKRGSPADAYGSAGAGFELASKPRQEGQRIQQQHDGRGAPSGEPAAARLGVPGAEPEQMPSRQQHVAQLPDPPVLPLVELFEGLLLPRRPVRRGGCQTPGRTEVRRQEKRQPTPHFCQGLGGSQTRTESGRGRQGRTNDS